MSKFRSLLWNDGQEGYSSVLYETGQNGCLANPVRNTATTTFTKKDQDNGITKQQEFKPRRNEDDFLFSCVTLYVSDSNEQLIRLFGWREGFFRESTSLVADLAGTSVVAMGFVVVMSL
uniref:Uncharacterized protein n=1 Tax=Tanacetum cinerariifolium TaxID=118510 RepID=A0A6L2MSY6_TANCI|nr:hypothetical protein [Tanacetum cinerariifolium]